MVSRPRQVNNLFNTIFNTTILLTEQVLEQIEISCSNGKKVLYTNKFDSMVRVDIVEDVKMAKMTLERVYNTFFQSRSKISWFKIDEI